jgi:AcrR family transcriptional regulator
VASAVNQRRGRPPDRDLEPRVYRATLALYGEVGWAGFSLDLVARRARAGKAALYGRWGNKETLIVEALKYRLNPLPRWVDTGCVRTDLITLARDVLESHVHADGLVMLRAQIEAKVYPELLGQAIEDWQKQDSVVFRPVILRAIDRGELPVGTSPSLVLDAVIGILVNHVLWTPADKLPALADNSVRYVESIVDFVLSAVGYCPLDDESQPAP